MNIDTLSDEHKTIHRAVDRYESGGMGDGHAIQRKYAPAIAKIIERVADIYGSSYRDTWSDFLDASTATFTRMPDLIAGMKEGGDRDKLIDPPDMVEMWERLDVKYRTRENWQSPFGQAFGNLLLSVREGWSDVLGATFEGMGKRGLGSARAGQFLTPWNVSLMMAQMIMGDMEAQIHGRIKKALLNPSNIMGHAVLIGGSLFQAQEQHEGPSLQLDEQAQRYYFERVIPAALPYYEPIRVMEPAVGSGGMLLAGASQVPRWALDMNLVQFFGMDIDLTMIKMCKLNCMLYGINDNTWLRCALEMSDVEIEQTPQPFKMGYMLAREAHEKGDQVTVSRIADDLREQKADFDPTQYKQGSLFE